MTGKIIWSGAANGGWSPSGYWVTCDCGWYSPRIRPQAEAEADLADHMQEAHGQAA